MYYFEKRRIIDRLNGVMLRKRIGVFGRVGSLFLKGRDVSIMLMAGSEFSIKNEIEVLKKIYEFLIRYID